MSQYPFQIRDWRAHRRWSASLHRSPRGSSAPERNSASACSLALVASICLASPTASQTKRCPSTRRLPSSWSSRLECNMWYQVADFARSDVRVCCLQRRSQTWFSPVNRTVLRSSLSPCRRRLQADSPTWLWCSALGFWLEAWWDFSAHLPLLQAWQPPTSCCSLPRFYFSTIQTLKIKYSVPCLVNSRTTDSVKMKLTCIRKNN